MARSRSYIPWALVLGTVLVAAPQQYGQDQASPSNPSDAEAKKGPTSSPSVELSKQQIDELIERVYGRDSEQARRPIRLWLPNFSMVLSAKEVGELGGRTVRFRHASAAVLDPNDFNSKATLFDGQEIAITLSGVLKRLGDLKNHSVTAAEICNVKRKITLQMGPNKIVEAALVNVEAPAVAPAPVPKEAAVQLPARAPMPVAAPPVIDEIVLTGQSKKETKSRLAALGLGLRFQFDLPSGTSTSELLPAAPKLVSKPAPWNNEDLTKVPQVSFGEPISKPPSEIKAMEETAYVLAKINHLNRRKTDGFLHTLLPERADLQGLPFLMGDECRMREADAKVFAQVASNLRQTLADPNSDRFRELVQVLGAASQIGNATNQKEGLMSENASHEQINRSLVAALTQILMPEPENARLGLARILAAVPNVEATKALARLAIFSAEESVRSAAIAGLKLRRDQDYTDVLVQGFHYPLPAVARRAADALVKLERKDLLPQLIAILEEADPRLPVTETRDGKERRVVRELIRVNHLQNCMLCHAPGNSDNIPEGILKASVPLPNVPLPKPSEGGGYEERASELPDTVVRIDMTYLRQDFSLMMPVSDSQPWPDTQRFDFLVRTRVLGQQESDAYGQEAAKERGQQSPYHRAALYALRELTGRDTEPTSAAWRKLLRIPAVTK